MARVKKRGGGLALVPEADKVLSIRAQCGIKPRKLLNLERAQVARYLEQMDLPYNTQPRFTCWVVEHALLQTKFVLVDVGVQGGIHPRWKALGNFLQVYGFDPLTEAIEPLTRSTEPNHEYFSTALGDYDGERKLFVPSVLPAASFFPRDAEQDQARMTIDAGNWAATKTRRVPVRRLDTLSQHWPHNIDFLKLDCEGFEPAVLAGAKNSTAQALAIETEMGFSSIHWPQTHFSAVYDQLVPYGFRLSNLAFNRVSFSSYLQRATLLSRPGRRGLCLPTWHFCGFVLSIPDVIQTNPNLRPSTQKRNHF